MSLEFFSMEPIESPTRRHVVLIRYFVLTYSNPDADAIICVTVDWNLIYDKAIHIRRQDLDRRLTITAWENAECKDRWETSHLGNQDSRPRWWWHCSPVVFVRRETRSNVVELTKWTDDERQERLLEIAEAFMAQIKAP